MLDLNDWLTRKDVLKYFRISISTYRRWKVNKILKGIKKGNIILYHISTMKKILAGFKTDKTS